MNNEELRGLLVNSKEEINKAVKTIGGFQSGKLKPLKTSMEHLNNACLGGLIPGLIISVLARPQHGKSYALHSIKEDVLNQTELNVKFLLYNWEMTWMSLILVQLKKKLKKSFKDILLNKPLDEEVELYKEVMGNMRDERMTTVSKALSPDEWNIVTRLYIEDNLDADLILVGTDHLGIIVGEDKTKATYKFMEYQNSIKLDYSDKVCFLNLAQLKREIEALWRNKDTNPTGLRVFSEHVMNADSIVQFSDVVMAQVIPERANMEQYTSVNKKRYEHLKDHFIEDTNPTSEYVRLKGNNRVYFDFVKKRLPEDGEPSLYCHILNQEAEEYIEATSKLEKDYNAQEEPIDF